MGESKHKVFWWVFGTHATVLFLLLFIPWIKSCFHPKPKEIVTYISVESTPAPVAVVQPLPEPVHLIAANLPYVREADINELTPEIAKYEPRTALSGGASGLEALKRLIIQSSPHLLKGGGILLEIGYDQGPDVLKLAKKHYPQADCRINLDLSGTERLLTILDRR